MPKASTKKKKKLNIHSKGIIMCRYCGNNFEVTANGNYLGNSRENVLHFFRKLGGNPLNTCAIN